MENTNNTPMIFENKDLGMGIKVAMFGDQVYAVGSHLARTLGYAKPEQALVDNVYEHNKVNVSDLKNSILECIPPEQMGSTALAEFDSFLNQLSLNAKSISIGRTQLIDESGIYQLILRSNLPSAFPFQSWVCSEVIPSIRRHGMYLAGQESLSTEEFNQLKNQIAELTTELNAQRAVLS